MFTQANNTASKVVAGVRAGADVGANTASKVVAGVRAGADVGAKVTTGLLKEGADAGARVTTGAYGLLKDTVLDVKDLVVSRADAPQPLIDAPTPEDRWYTSKEGWPQAAVEELPASLIALAGASSWIPSRWTAPPALTPTESQEPHLFRERLAYGGPIGELSVEILQCEMLPPSLARASGGINACAVFVFESCAAASIPVRSPDGAPCWTCDKPRACRFPICCPYSNLDVAIIGLVEGVRRDDLCGRVVVDLGVLRGRTVYDCWYPLHRDRHGGATLHRASGSTANAKRGSVRLRFSVRWSHDRLRLLRYPNWPPPLFALPCKTRRALRHCAFAVQGQHYNPARFDWRVFESHVDDLKAAWEALVRLAADVTYWRWPSVNLYLLALWQYLISFPLHVLVAVPATALLLLVASAFHPRPPHSHGSHGFQYSARPRISRRSRS